MLVSMLLHDRAAGAGPIGSAVQTRLPTSRVAEARRGAQRSLPCERSAIVWQKVGWTVVLAVVLAASRLVAQDPTAPMESLPKEVMDRIQSAKVRTQTLPEESMDMLLSVLVHREWIFASTPKGIYRASPHDKKWVSLPTPSYVPCVGWLAKQEPASSSIYYSAPRTGAVIMSSTAGNTFGLYRFDPRGEHWELVNSQHNFMHVYVPDDWSMYGIDESIPDYPGPPNPYQRVVRMSTDSGRHWENIWRNLAPGFAPSSIFPDPDHEGLVCVNADFGKKTVGVLQASDKSYHWRALPLRNWEDPTRYFFCQPLGGGNSVLQATLANYFAYPFLSETEISAFDIVVSPSYDFNESERVVIPVEVRFRQRPRISVTIVDTERGSLVWGLNRVLPDGTREIVRAGSNCRAAGTEKEILFDGTREFTSTKPAMRPRPSGSGWRPMRCRRRRLWWRSTGGRRTVLEGPASARWRSARMARCSSATSAMRSRAS